MADTETRLLPKLIADCHASLQQLRHARTQDPDHPVIPTLPHAIDCDICSSGRRVDLLLDEISHLHWKADQCSLKRPKTS